jgi:hypothetical protein
MDIDQIKRANYKLFKEIISLSVATTWEEAKLEWVLDHIYSADEAQKCLCTHYPIIEICTMRNIKNNNHALVGNCCVNRFIGIESNKMFSSLKRIRQEMSKSISKVLLDFCFEKGILNNWERGFYLDNLKRRKLTSKQEIYKQKINKKILDEFDKKVQI